MMRYFLIFPILLLLACKSTENKNAQNTQNQSLPVSADSVYRFQVSFLSIGSGIDRIAIQKFTVLIDEFNLSNQVLIAPKIINWGREGEQDFCFKLSGIEPSLQEKFISESKALFLDNKLVFSSENQPAKHKSKD